MAFVYSFCFWFSLRLGGIIIGLFSMLQGLLTLGLFAFAHNKVKEMQNEIDHWLTHMNLIYTKDYLENVKADPDKYITLGISTAVIYLIFCAMYVYGAYMYKNYLMTAFLLTELIRLIVMSALVITWLLILKQNTMDIGLLIGASVASGFFLLGMYYLWVCAASLPVLINEMEKDEQLATINKLQQLLQTNQKFHRAPEQIISFVDSAPFDSGNYLVPKNKRNHKPDKPFVPGSRISIPNYYR